MAQSLEDFRSIYVAGESDIMRRSSFLCAQRGRTMTLRVESHARGTSNRDTFLQKSDTIVSHLRRTHANFS